MNEERKETLIKALSESVRGDEWKCEMCGTYSKGATCDYCEQGRAIYQQPTGIAGSAGDVSDYAPEAKADEYTLEELREVGNVFFESTLPIEVTQTMQKVFRTALAALEREAAREAEVCISDELRKQFPLSYSLNDCDWGIIRGKDGMVVLTIGYGFFGTQNYLEECRRNRTHPQPARELCELVVKLLNREVR